jgi:hypothetical protein
LPRLRIKRPHVGDKIIDQKDPGTAYLGTRNHSGLRPAAEFFRVAAQEIGGFPEIEGSHSGFARRESVPA